MTCLDGRNFFIYQDLFFITPKQIIKVVRDQFKNNGTSVFGGFVTPFAFLTFNILAVLIISLWLGVVQVSSWFISKLSVSFWLYMGYPFFYLLKLLKQFCSG